MNVDTLKIKFQPQSARREWPSLDTKTLNTLLNDQRAAIDARNEQIIAQHMTSKPERTANVDVHTLWERELTQKENARDSEVQAFESRRSGLCESAGSLNGLFGRYGSYYEAYERALTTAWDGIEPQVTSLLDEVQTQEAELEALKKQRMAIVADLRKSGVTGELSEYLDAYEAALERAFFIENCLARHIDPDKAPVRPAYPDQPVPLTPKTPRSYFDKFGLADIAMAIGAMGFGSAIAGATRSVIFDSKGWHFTPLYWVMFIIGTVSAFMVGKKAIPWLISTINLNTVNIYPYLTNDADHTSHLAKARRAAMAARAGLVSIFLIFASIDFGGWYIFAVDHNAAYADDDGATPINPKLAGLVLSAVTCLMAFIKTASVSSAINDLRDKLQDEIKQLVARWNQSCLTYNRALEAIQTQLSLCNEYDARLKEAQETAKHLLRSEGGVIRDAVAAYRSHYDQVKGQTLLTDKIEKLVAEALESTRASYGNVQDLETKIDRIYSQLEPVLHAPVLVQTT